MTNTANPTLKYYWEDLPVGATIELGSLTVSREEVIEFASKYDPQPFHLDDAAARDTLFGGLAASGWHTAAVTMRLQVTSGLPIAGGIIGAGGELTWPRPTRATDVLHVVSEVIQIQPSKSKPDRGMVTVRSETRNQHGDVLQLTTVRIVVPRRPAAGGAGA